MAAKKKFVTRSKVERPNPKVKRGKPNTSKVPAGKFYESYRKLANTALEHKKETGRKLATKMWGDDVAMMKRLKAAEKARKKKAGAKKKKS